MYKGHSRQTTGQKGEKQKCFYCVECKMRSIQLTSRESCSQFAASCTIIFLRCLIAGFIFMETCCVFKQTTKEEVDEVSFDVFLSCPLSNWSSCSGRQRRKRFLPDVSLWEKLRETGPKTSTRSKQIRRLFVAVWGGRGGEMVRRGEWL